MDRRRFIGTLAGGLLGAPLAGEAQSRRQGRTHAAVRIPLVLLCLLAVATSASAECAWVLWGQTQDPWGALVEVRLEGWPSREACEQERGDREKAPPALRMASYSCLPDTVDPRGPKGK